MNAIEVLLSGLTGGIVATVISNFYHYIAERKKLRADIMFEIIGYIDDIYSKLRAIHTDTDTRLTSRIRELTNQEYKHFSRELKDLLNNQKIKVKLEIIYGKGKACTKFNQLIAFIWDTTLIVWNGKLSD